MSYTCVDCKKQLFNTPYYQERRGKVCEVCDSAYHAVRIIIAGSRGFDDYDLLTERVRFYIKDLPKNKIRIISGTARGADELGEKFANDNAMPVTRMPADWDKHGKAAGYIRNTEMARYGTHCIVFWDGQSKGAKHMIDIAVKFRLPTRVVKYTHK